jgi:hypothetical protein
LKLTVASSCAKESSIAFTSTDTQRNPAPSRVIEKFPKGQFEAFAELLEFRRLSETPRQVSANIQASSTFSVQT